MYNYKLHLDPSYPTQTAARKWDLHPKF